MSTSTNDKAAVGASCTNLLSCPFCRSNQVKSIFVYGIAYQIECQKCKASGPVIPTGKHLNAEEMAIAGWNRREP